MLNWLFRRREKNNKLMLEMIRAAAEGASAAKLRQAVATISKTNLAGDQTEIAATAASILTIELGKEANVMTHRNLHKSCG